MNKFVHHFTFYLLCFVAPIIHAQRNRPILEDTTNIIISANRISEAKINVAQQVQVIQAEAIKRLNAPTTAELLSNLGGITVQKSQQGGGSPTIRGFEASRVMLVVDGVRMNNLIYRAGHLQNVLTLDQSILERVEVLFGPASAIYGSDALGGVVHFVTRKPELFVLSPEHAATIKTKNARNAFGNAYIRYATANNEQTAHFDANIGTEKWGSLTSVTVSRFGDLKTGSKRSNQYATFGLRPNFAVRENGIDVVKINPNPNVQVQSGYDQLDVLQRFRFKPKVKQTHDLNLQVSTSSNVPRYDRLTDSDGKGGLRQAEWYYGPQERLMASYEVNRQSVGKLANVRLNLAYQKIQESRHTRRFGNANLQHRIEDVNVFSYRLDALQAHKSGYFQYGFEGQRDNLVSTAENENIVTGVKSALDTRYPDGINKVGHDAIFMMHSWDAHTKWRLTQSIRGFRTTLHSTFIDKSFFKFPFNEIKQENISSTADFGVIYKPISTFRTALLFNSGYRVPNVDDLAKIFETVKGKIIVPNPDLKPEKTLGMDLNLSLNLPNFELEQVFFRTNMRDAIVTDVFSYNGQNQMLYDGTLSTVYASQNKRAAYTQGVSTSIKAFAKSPINAEFGITLLKGRVVENSQETPLDHISPLYGRFALNYTQTQHSIQVFTIFNGKKDIQDYLLNAEDNEAYATPDGMPAWWTLNLRYQWQIRPKIALQFGLENALDVHYRAFASGISGAGRNFMMTLRFGQN